MCSMTSGSQTLQQITKILHCGFGFWQESEVENDKTQFRHEFYLMIYV